MAPASRGRIGAIGHDRGECVVAVSVIKTSECARALAESVRNLASAAARAAACRNHPRAAEIVPKVPHSGRTLAARTSPRIARVPVRDRSSLSNFSGIDHMRHPALRVGGIDRALGHVRVHRARLDRKNADAVFLRFRRGMLRQSNLARFRHGVPGQLGRKPLLRRAPIR